MSPPTTVHIALPTIGVSTLVGQLHQNINIVGKKKCFTGERYPHNIAYIDAETIKMKKGGNVLCVITGACSFTI